jgi:hypothetical protein
MLDKELDVMWHEGAVRILGLLEVEKVDRHAVIYKWECLV